MPQSLVSLWLSYTSRIRSRGESPRRVRGCTASSASATPSWKCIAESQDSTVMSAQELAQGKPLCAETDADISDVLTLIEQHRFRRVPVVHHLRLVGMIGEADVAPQPLRKLHRSLRGALALSDPRVGTGTGRALCRVCDRYRTSTSTGHNRTPIPIGHIGLGTPAATGQPQPARAVQRLLHGRSWPVCWLEEGGVAEVTAAVSMEVTRCVSPPLFLDLSYRDLVRLGRPGLPLMWLQDRLAPVWAARPEVRLVDVLKRERPVVIAALPPSLAPSSDGRTGRRRVAAAPRCAAIHCSPAEGLSSAPQSRTRRRCSRSGC